MRVYLDWNATAPPLPDVIAAMAEAAQTSWGNPSSVHATGRAGGAIVEDGRAAIAELMDADPRDVVFTSGGTEANTLAVRSAERVATSRLEHPSIVRAVEGRARWVRVRPEGTIDLEDLEAALNEGVRFVALQAVNAETGVVQPIAEAIALAKRFGARVH